MEHSIENVLERTQSQHGFWLINHKNIIRAALITAIMTKGIQGTVDLLNETDSQLSKDIYKMIETYKEQKNGEA